MSKHIEVYELTAKLLVYPHENDKDFEVSVVIYADGEYFDELEMTEYDGLYQRIKQNVRNLNE